MKINVLHAKCETGLSQLYSETRSRLRQNETLVTKLLNKFYLPKTYHSIWKCNKELQLVGEIIIHVDRNREMQGAQVCAMRRTCAVHSERDWIKIDAHIKMGANERQKEKALAHIGHLRDMCERKTRRVCVCVCEKGLGRVGQLPIYSISPFFSPPLNIVSGIRICFGWTRYIILSVSTCAQSVWTHECIASEAN